jgi:hypothetical protein
MTHLIHGGLVSRHNFETYISPYGKTVHLMSTEPVNYSHGGMIKWEKGQYHPLRNDLTHDNKRVLLEVGSLVIPRPIVPLVNSYIEQTGPLTIPTIKDTSQLVEVIVMPEEIIVPKKYARQVQSFLNRHGITLPIPHESLF